MKITEIDRRGFLKGLGAAGVATATGGALAKKPAELAVSGYYPVYVNPGDTIYSIARGTMTDPRDIMKINGFTNKTHLEKGQLIKIPEYGKHPDHPLKTAQPAAPAGNAKPVPWNHPLVRVLLQAAELYIDKNDKKQLAAFISQCAHESDNFHSLEEYGSDAYFTHMYDITQNPKKAKDLGNTEPGDGARFKGRGFIQITGRWNYDQAGKWISKITGRHFDFIKNPEMLATPGGGAMASLWYWVHFSKDRINDMNNTPEVTYTINKGMRGEKDREQKHLDWKTALGVKVPQPGKPTRVASR